MHLNQVIPEVLDFTKKAVLEVAVVVVNFGELKCIRVVS